MSSEVSRDRVLQAMAEFDQVLRPTPEWASWEAQELIRFVIERDGRRYPLKPIWMQSTDGRSLRGANKRLEGLGFTIGTLEPLAVPAAPERVPKVWWVNQGDSYRAESAGGFIWAPKTDKRGVARATYARLLALQPGDILVHYADAAIKAIGEVTARSVDVATPGSARRTKNSRRVAVRYFELAARAVARDRLIELYRGLEVPDGPFQIDRAIKNGYLWQFSLEGLRRLREAVGAPWPAWARVGDEAAAPTSAAAEIVAPSPPAPPAFEIGEAVRLLIAAVARRGFVFEPWQIAAFITALRTKPFVILAGVSGTGKSRLPCLVADLARCAASVIPVRPDWTDSSDVLGYVDLQNVFRPGPLLQAAERAALDPGRLHLCVLDEMNLGRVEHYFAEVLSRIEGRTVLPDGTLDSAPLITRPLSADDARWGRVALPANLALVGTVNMDESAHTFSRKVLDRAFTLELSEVDLRQWGELALGAPLRPWPAEAWATGALDLARRAGSAEVRKQIDDVVETLVEVNAILTQAQLQIGYRTRNEIVQFVLNARAVAASFVTRAGRAVAPLDLALLMKLLPRVVGGSGPIRQVVLGLLGFAVGGAPLIDDQQAEEVVKPWRGGGRRATLDQARFPHTAARLCMMWDRLVFEGITSFWL